MPLENILQYLDSEIAKLKQVRALLSATGKITARINEAGIKSATKPVRKAVKPIKKAAKRVLSPEARKAIADAQRRRWAAQKSK